MIKERKFDMVVDADPVNNRWSLKELVERLWDMRDREITRLWQRGVFLATFILGEFAAYGMFERALMSRSMPGAFAANAVGCLIALVGLVSSLLWIAMAKGSNAWYQVYERAIGGLFAQSNLPETQKLLSETCPSAGFAQNLTWSNGLLRGCGGTYSLPRINVAIGHLCAFVWVCLMLVHLTLLVCGLCNFDFRANMIWLKLGGAILIGLFVLFVLIVFNFYLGRFLQSKSLINYAEKEQSKTDAVIIAGFDFLARMNLVRKARMAVVALFGIFGFSAFATPYVTNVVAKTRMPWNGLIDVSYEIVGSTNGLEYAYGQLTATDRTRGKTYVASTFEKKIDLTEGKHTAIWNMAADNGFTSKDVVFNMSIRTPALYCVIDLSDGPTAKSYSVSDLDDVPAGGWTDEYKTTKLVLRWINPGSVLLGGIKPVTITRPFYIGVFEVTQKQYALVKGSNPSSDRGDMRPVELVSYSALRGSAKGAQWPSCAEVDEASFLGILKGKVRIDIDLPTEAQWEYACRAGADSDFNNGGSSESDLAQVGRYEGNRSDGKGGYSQHTTVGSYLPNTWGLYDMHGNVEEWCLDWYGDLSNEPVEDWKGLASGYYRIMRGGHYNGYYYSGKTPGYIQCGSSYRSWGSDTIWPIVGFRLVAGIDR